ncbi:nitrogen permease regulator 2 [Lentinula lateritia]|uniref:Nitrogen permease regulator 2 n=1 Tax=Lentinula lateritia TaxID=40482 RepID=A0ABQ8VNL8_9AGAR|nr:nitrogen permease regulator 2 [Lentinula lateritia]
MGTFLPRIQSVFYAGFDLVAGPKIICQVPEGLITAPLFNFEEVSKLVIPGPALCGRLVICATKRHRIMGFPSQLRGKYQRNFFRFNLCFVFERTADLSCYEPIVRKISREESEFLSTPGNEVAIHAIIEQLYEDLNSYSETSISIDQFNSIELKIFPFYPNPPAVKDWMVPIALINLVRRIEDNWDLTMSKVYSLDAGVNHVSRIAHLADCDVNLTREAISHLLYYQVIMTIDIFQYSNMYTLRKSIQWLADEAHVKEECGPYSTKPGESYRFPIPDWPKLLHLYSRMKPGRTVLEWLEEYKVQELGIDVRRFTSFGVIKGFLRRVHRYPIFLPESSKSITQSPITPVPLAYPTDLLELLDGEHHTDEVAVKFEAGWPLLEDWLRRIGEDHNGRVLVIYR